MVNEPPDLLVDRSLGLKSVPAFLTKIWPSRVHTLNEIYGTGPVADVEWMAFAEAREWIVVCKDGRIRRRVGERRIMSSGTLRVFCLVNGQLTSDVQVHRFATASAGMIRVSALPGPWMYGVYAHGLKELTLYS